MKLLITSLAVLFLSTSALAQENEVYEYLTMVKMNYDLHISIGSEGYEKVNIKSETEEKMYDLSAVNNQISGFEGQGWEFVSAVPFSISGGQYPGVPMYQVVMRRPKK